ncbi:glycosyltransferase family 39 protein [Xanthocytophaga agilis]|uniref:Glycosyltransferase family 39 protein n=1 Tax=Xanthocytophaga agilis TaxID=3048010 RepID=A0AAE3R897_9BACT|nr:glycosyltransferase family 39 protein [Xanthocytophaga agilis]MDJ1503224.1 glycosyltransferase family 39 protein [Xanthocytophaga agilis]
MNKQLLYSVLIALVAGLFFLPFLGGVRLFDWDEINFAEISREMIVLNDYLRVHVDFLPFWEKPPFFFWLQSAAMHLFGIGEYAARFPNAICGMITLVLLFRVGAKLYDVRFGLLWAGAYIGSVLPHLYFKSGIIDPWFNLFIFLGLLGIILFYWKKDQFVGILLFRNKYSYLLFGGFLLGVGVITKGPVAYLIVCLTLFVYWLVNRFYFFINAWHFLLFSFMTCVMTLAWYGLETWQHGPWFINEFMKYNYRLFSTPDAGHAGFPGYHFAVLLVGCFPASIFALRAFRNTPQQFNYQRDFKRWMIILFWVVLILFTIVKSKIVHYSSMCYFPMTYLTALTIYQMWEGKIRFNGWMRFGLIAVGSLYCIATIALPFLGRRIDLVRPFVEKDPFALANLDANINWSLWCIIPGIILLIAIVTGIRFLNRNQPEETMKGAIAFFAGTAVFVLATLIAYIGRIEGISQDAAMRFYEAQQGKDAYVVTHKFRSYGRYFYPREPNHANPKRHDMDWLYYGDIDKDVYVVAKITSEAETDTIHTLKKIGEENGFLFYKREKKK